MAQPRTTPKPLPRLLVLEDADAEAQLCKSIAEFKGPGTQLESAIGALVLGQHMGTRALKMLHNPATYKKYETVLGIRFEDHCPERTHLSTKLTGIKIADKLGKFWDVVMGRTKVEKKGWMDSNTTEATPDA